MSAIAGISSPGKRLEVESMLSQMQHRGPIGTSTIETPKLTLGIAWTRAQSIVPDLLEQRNLALDGDSESHFASAQATENGVILSRDPIGVVPLYYGVDNEHHLCFASEIKGLSQVTTQINELPPGHIYDGNNLTQYFELEKQEPLQIDVESISQELRQRLCQAVSKHVTGSDLGSWLSGGLDSSIMAAIAKLYMDRLPSFAAGLPGAPDLEYARQVADYIHTEHYETVIQPVQLIEALPDVIYQLESFDALLVRSSIMNNMVAKLASEHVAAVFSGEGGDELFAGYEYLKSIDMQELPDELVDITGRLHNTALQRVDRSASAHGIVAHVGFLDPDVVEYALQIPAEYKIHEGIEKWILRKAFENDLPETVVQRPKAKFWEGAGVQDYLAEYAEQEISNSDFNQERTLPNGWKLNTKEELLYYRIFREHFGELEDLGWMGRTKGSPISN